VARRPARSQAVPSTFGAALVLLLSTIAPAAAAAGAASSPTRAGTASAAAAVPVMGRYAATLCVVNAGQPANCGPAEAQVRRGGAVDVRVSDIVYRLARSGNAAVVVVTQGQMMIDVFDTGPQWSGRSLSFVDVEKQVRYQLELGIRQAERH
jgi:hypothetical protein